MTKVLILGCGGHGKVVAETCLSSGLASAVAFLDDRFTHSEFSHSVLRWPVIGPCPFLCRQNLGIPSI